MRQFASADRISIGAHSVAVLEVVKMMVLPITPEIAARTVSFPDSYSKDPQERLIGATALVEGIQFITHDKQKKKSRMIPIAW